MTHEILSQLIFLSTHSTLEITLHKVNKWEKITGSNHGSKVRGVRSFFDRVPKRREIQMSNKWERITNYLCNNIKTARFLFNTWQQKYLANFSWAHQSLAEHGERKKVQTIRILEEIMFRFLEKMIFIQEDCLILISKRRKPSSFTGLRKIEAICRGWF